MCSLEMMRIVKAPVIYHQFKAKRHQNLENLFFTTWKKSQKITTTDKNKNYRTKKKVIHQI